MRGEVERLLAESGIVPGHDVMRYTLTVAGDLSRERAEARRAAEAEAVRSRVAGWVQGRTARAEAEAQRLAAERQAKRQKADALTAKLRARFGVEEYGPR